MGFVPAIAHRNPSLNFLAAAVRKALLAGDYATIQMARGAVPTHLCHPAGFEATAHVANRESWELFEAVAASLTPPRHAISCQTQALPPLGGVRAQIDLLEHMAGPALNEPAPPPREC